MSPTRILTALLALSAPVVARAQDAAPPVTVGYTVPESPAFTFLGVSPTKVSRASNARDLGAALINSVDSTGRLLTGVALSATVWTLLPDVNIGPERYRNDWKAYALANAQLSLGTLRSSGDSGDTDIALGLRTTLVDHSDPMQNAAFVTELTDSLDACLEAAQPTTLPGAARDSVVRTDLGESDADVQCGLAADGIIRGKWNQENWNKPALSLGAGMGWRVPGSRLGSMDHLGLSTWMVGSFPLGAGSQVNGQLQYDHRSRRDTLAETDVLTFGARMTRGASTRNLFVEVVGTQRLNTVAGVSRSNVQWSGGVEFQIAPDYWLSTGFGKRYTEQGEPDRVAVIANLRWGMTSKSRFKLVHPETPR
jgi:hypothetical protein